MIQVLEEDSAGRIGKVMEWGQAGAGGGERRWEAAGRGAGAQQLVSSWCRRAGLQAETATIPNLQGGEGYAVYYGPCDVLLYITLPTLAIYALNLQRSCKHSFSLSLCLSPPPSLFASLSASQSGWVRATEL